ncbi:MAG: TrpR-like protein YerC/YecD [Firmicutes bacterium]|nr:TrpR-like protein YerC/YecD [Clostridiales bacterium]MBQ9931369.1 TrpR-like protein YerC/YecD [Bacillota bacterium]
MSYESKLKSPEMDELLQAILLLETEEEAYRFFDDLCTIKEMKAICQRFQVARCLTQQKTYAEIEALTGASTATISRVNRSLAYGSDGYKVVFERMD